MLCEEFGKMLDNYEHLTDEEKLSLNEHAAQCAHCREELDFMLRMLDQLNTLPAIEVPADFSDKLNKRLDLERGVGFGRMLSSVRRNYRRYSTVAACLMLAVIIGANGKALINRLQPEVYEGTVVENTDKPSGAEEQIETAVTETKPDKEESVKEDVSENIQKASADTAGSGRTVAAAKPKSEVNNKNTAVRETSGSVNQFNAVSSDKAQQSINTEPDAQTGFLGRGRMAEENTETDTASLEAGSYSVRKTPENYTIARGVYRLPDPEIAEVEAPSAINNEPLEISEIKAQPDTTIARGRYYIPADDGYIAIDNGNEIGVNGEDAERAAQLIEQYADVKNDSYYVINSEDIPSMLEHMDGEGITYQNKMGSSDNEKVSFKLVIE